MQDLNEIRITGTLFNEPTFQSTSKGGKVSRFSVGVRRKDPSKVYDFMNVVAWDDAAEFVKDNFHEQERISIKGSMHSEKYVSHDGTEKKTYRIYAEDIMDPEDSTTYYIQFNSKES